MNLFRRIQSYLLNDSAEEIERLKLLEKFFVDTDHNQPCSGVFKKTYTSTDDDAINPYISGIPIKSIEDLSDDTRVSLLDDKGQWDIYKMPDVQ